ncbi:hypothetical protein LPB140_09475 [Sphingorhabdus lutea]|uniref:Uncharacterized protein n=1 Tax=Sphingorhabdus lutea TaxID=1913578 RepID=A0A1L3JCY9_9SPHN|nr:hypothetical protein [Sphingorhabdus lutea]APG62982.1 hypothetical protein LPB140_09475 [Sphingorhabdus lutea]
MRISSIQRVKFSIMGMVAVLLFVTLAQMTLDNEDKALLSGLPTEEELSDPSNAVSKGIDIPKEPLAELGATPAPVDEAVKAKAMNKSKAAEPGANPVVQSTDNPPAKK